MNNDRDLLDAFIPCPTCQQLGTITQAQADKRAEVMARAEKNYLWAEGRKRDNKYARAWILGICLVLAAAISGGAALIYNHLSYEQEQNKALEITCTQEASLETCSCLEALAQSVDAEEGNGQQHCEECVRAHAKVTQCYRDLAVTLTTRRP